VVVLRGVAFNPAVVTVPVGTTVDWKWEDNGIAHDVVSVGPGPLHSALQATGDYDYRFSTPGTYHYQCSVHPFMLGTIVVQAN
jgi:plastocyanin